MKTVECKTQMEIIVAHLWKLATWQPTHLLQGVETEFGFIGSAGHARVRELARNDCPEKLRDKIERKRGSQIGRDPRYEFFRYRKPLTSTQRAAKMVELFDAGESAEVIFAV
jgi:hypothetical protein